MSPRSPSRKNPSPPADWSARLRDAGLRATALTLSVLRRLEHSPHPCSHDELAHDLVAAGDVDKVDRVTLYRILDRLTQSGLLMRVQGSDRASRYSLATPDGANGYFECGQCHEITALPSDPELEHALQRLERRLNRSGAQTAKSALTILGTCRNCAHRER